MNKPLFFKLLFAFVLCTIVGTVTHELGHYAVAKSLGYNPKLHYASTAWKSYDHTPTKPGDSFLITLGGPMETLSIGTLGFFLLVFYRKQFQKADALVFKQWVIIFMALFWLRQPFNLFTWLGNSFVTGKLSGRGDEIKIAKYLQLPVWSIVTIAATIGIVILTVLIFKFIPLKQRPTFIASGLVGGMAGYFFWLVLFGKYIMP
ncbi:MAG: hypothetical protein V4565_03140 [Bacteroidota bacterium]